MHARVREEIEQRGLPAPISPSSRRSEAAADLLRPAPPEEARRCGTASAKYEMLMSMLESMVETGRRIIVFSQFVEMLELIEEGLKELGSATPR
jgi:SNF2 family DNA or RNA helicase